MTTVQEMLQKKGQSLQPAQGRTILGQDRAGAATTRFAMTDENIEEAAERTLDRLMSTWSEEKEIQERTFQSPEDYTNRVSKYWKSYNGLRATLDASVVFVIGETLEACRQRFFNDETEDPKSHKRFKDYLESHIPFSVRQAYDFMAISQRLALFRERKLGMEQFRALLAIAKAGVDLANLPSTIEAMSVKDLLALKPKQTSSAQPQMVIGHINAITRKLEKTVSELYLSEVKDNLSAKQKKQLLSFHQKLTELAETLGKHILDSNY
jgi:hypothetical protein